METLNMLKLDKQRLLISFSGGRTSGYMTHRLLKEMPDGVEYKIVFANTGQEDPKTLDFVHSCERVFGWDVTWIEANVQQGVRKGTTHRVVSYETASRNGEPFEEVVKKYGLPNQSMPHCTRELKLQPIRSFCKSLGWERKTYYSAVGIRSDEIDRISSYAEKENLVYPLVKWGIKKSDVLEWWSKQNFDLYVPEHRGNCLWCWKKSFKKLVTVYREDPKTFDFPLKMEKENSMSGALAKKSGNPQTFFRTHKSAKDIIDMALNGHEGFEDPNFVEECAESCEVFSDTSLGVDYG